MPTLHFFDGPKDGHAIEFPLDVLRRGRVEIAYMVDPPQSLAAWDDISPDEPLFHIAQYVVVEYRFYGQEFWAGFIGTEIGNREEDRAMERFISHGTDEYRDSLMRYVTLAQPLMSSSDFLAGIPEFRFAVNPSPNPEPITTADLRAMLEQPSDGAAQADGYSKRVVFTSEGGFRESEN